LITKDKLDLGIMAQHAQKEKAEWDEKVSTYQTELNKVREEWNIAEPGPKEALQIQIND